VASNVLFDFRQLGKPQFIVLGSVQIRVVRLLNSCDFCSQVLSVESLLKLDVASSSLKLEKSALRELQLAYCSSLASSYSSVADLAKLSLPRCHSYVSTAPAIYHLFIPHISVCPTSLASLDSILCGGFHRGHITELVGDSAAGGFFCWRYIPHPIPSGRENSAFAASCCEVLHFIFSWLL
jgi:hypothetical protein